MKNSRQRKAKKRLLPPPTGFDRRRDHPPSTHRPTSTGDGIANFVEDLFSSIGGLIVLSPVIAWPILGFGLSVFFVDKLERSNVDLFLFMGLWIMTGGWLFGLYRTVQEFPDTSPFNKIRRSVMLFLFSWPVFSIITVLFS